MITIRKYQVKDDVSKNELYAALDYVSAKFPSIQFKQTVFEIDPNYSQLHAHSIVFLKEKVEWATVSSFKDFRIYWRPIFDLRGARDYLNKVQ